MFRFGGWAGGGVGLRGGGLVTQAVSWSWIFFVNLPIGLVTAVVSARLLASDRGTGAGKGADVLGAALVTVALMLGVYAIVESSNYGLGSLHTLGFGGVALALLAAFIVRQATAPNPILPLRIFGSRKLSAANLVQALMSSAFLGFFFVASLDLQRVLGYGPLEIGLGFLPVAVVMGLFSVRFSALLINRFGPLPVLVAGQAVIVCALAVLRLGPTSENYMVHLLVPLAPLGLGGGLSFPSLTLIARADARPSDAGLASGVLNPTGQGGGGVGGGGGRRNTGGEGEPRRALVLIRGRQGRRVCRGANGRRARLVRIRHAGGGPVAGVWRPRQAEGDGAPRAQPHRRRTRCSAGLHCRGPVRLEQDVLRDRRFGAVVGAGHKDRLPRLHVRLHRRRDRPACHGQAHLQGPARGSVRPAGGRQPDVLRHAALRAAPAGHAGGRTHGSPGDGGHGLDASRPSDVQGRPDVSDAQR